MKRRLFIAVPWLLLIIVGLYHGKGLLTGSAVDFSVYHAGGRAILDQAPLYDLAVTRSGSRRALPFTYPPFAAVLFAPLALLPSRSARLAFELVSFLALVLTCWLVAGWAPRLAGRRTSPGMQGKLEVSSLAALILAGSLMFQPVVFCLEIGQVGLILLAAVVADAVLRWRGSGLLTGAATGIKITPAVFVVLMVLTRRWAEAARAAGAFAVTVAIGFAVQPGEAWRFWTSLLFDTERVGATARVSNGSIAGVFDRLKLGELGGTLSLLAILLVFVGGTWLAVSWWRRDRLVSTCVMGMTGLAISPISWAHHWVWFVPLITCLLALAFRAKAAGSIKLCITLTVVALGTSAFLLIDPRYIIRDRAFGPVSVPLNQLLAAGYLITGLLSLVVLWAALRLPIESDQAVPSAPARGVAG